MPFDGSPRVRVQSALGKIDQVIDLLATERRWCKGRFQTDDGRRCIVGALRAAGAEAILRKPILRAIENVTGERCRRIELFNDAPNTTHSRVLEVLLQARQTLLIGYPNLPPTLWANAIGQWLGFGAR